MGCRLIQVELPFCILPLSVGMACLGFAVNAPAIALLSVLVGLGGGLTQPLSMVVLAESVRREQRSGALGMRLMANRAVHFLAPLMFGAVLGMSGFGVSFGLSGMFVALVAVVLLRLQTRHRASEPGTPG
jgi:MFS family permease